MVFLGHVPLATAFYRGSGQGIPDEAFSLRRSAMLDSGDMCLPLARAQNLHPNPAGAKSAPMP